METTPIAAALLSACAGYGPAPCGGHVALESDANGNARLTAVLPGLTLEGAHGIVGKGVIVHAAPDDFKTQPPGNSGARMACGVIVKC